MSNISKEYVDFLLDSFKKINIDLSDKQVNQFITYYELLVEKNKVMNLTAITEYEEVVIKHFVDSVLVSNVKDFCNIDNIIDVGTGAGFPGIPLKIIYPNVKITLLDSLNKRINFLKDVIDIIGLKEVECIHGRAEDFGHNEQYREKYDICVSRAVANLSTLSEYCMPFIRVGGDFISYKASDIDDEIKSAENAIRKLGGRVETKRTVYLPTLQENNNIERNFVIINKVSEMNKKYPRKSGTPSKEPLC